MKIICQSTLDIFRAKRNCEWCGKSVAGCEPNHLRGKGFGGGFRLDVAINLIGMCRLCHQKYHDGNIKRADVESQVAKREGTNLETLREALAFLIRTPRDQAERMISTLDQPVAALVRRINIEEE